MRGMLNKRLYCQEGSRLRLCPTGCGRKLFVYPCMRLCIKFMVNDNEASRFGNLYAQETSGTLNTKWNKIASHEIPTPVPQSLIIREVVRRWINSHMPCKRRCIVQESKEVL